MSERLMRRKTGSRWPAMRRRPAAGRLISLSGRALAWLVLLSLTAWAAAALYFDLPLKAARMPAAAAYLGVVAAVLVLVQGQIRKALACLLGFAAVLAWWLSLEPSNDRRWLADVARTAWADIEGDVVTIHNVRNFSYRTETDYTVRWETRSYDIRQIRGVDLFVTFWGSPWIAHPILSFQFDDGRYVAFSVETRKEVGEAYSALKGFFRQYELVYVVGDERDLIRLRANYREGEDVYLYRTTATADAARSLFLDYLRTVNELHRRPAFYNAVTSNCTTNIRIHTAAVAEVAPVPWNWRLLLNGKADEFAYDHGRFVRDDLAFGELKRLAHIDEAARAADSSPDFSRLIREGRPGFVPPHAGPAQPP